MSKRMLIDASHPEETRVVVLDGTKVEEFDFEAASRRPLKGNIYLAKVTRVEPSLQAAFVEYGGNRQGFLAFSEIHPDYYQIPVADRMALLADQSRRLIDEDDEVDAVATTVAPSKPGLPVPDSSDEETDKEESAEATESADAEKEIPTEGETSEENKNVELDVADSDDEEDSEAGAPTSESADESSDDVPENDSSETDTGSDLAADDEANVTQEATDALEEPPEGGDSSSQEANQAEAPDESTPSDDKAGEEQLNDETLANEENKNEDEDGEPANAEVVAESAGTPKTAERKSARKRAPRRRHYKIQEVIRRKQIILVQVVKEERGNKGASLTTYLSLAGRYCVLMPNTPRGGGISRKITSATDRKRLKSAAQSLELPEGMGLIIRTAGANRTKAEIKRDYEYLLRLWDSVRELTLQSNAPALVYEEGNLIKRTIRDLYGKDVSEVAVDGEAGYRDAKDFMRMIMPSHAKNVKLNKDGLSLFRRYRVDSQLDAMFSPVVTLKSGGYIVINQTEALVAIDVNSGKATREHSIEETAHKTNLEAADEVGRQLRLRDLAGLIVIDFIDMEQNRNDRNVEKRMRDALRNDRARIQIGKISQFGLLEMSRQRLRAGVLAGSTVDCPHCDGLGYVRSIESASLQLLRALEEEAQQQTANSLIARAPGEIVIYAVNHKRSEIAEIEKAYETSVAFETKDDMQGGTFEIERVGKRTPPKPQKQAAVSIDDGFHEEEEKVEETDPIENAAEPETSSEDEPAEENGVRKRRRRRRRGGRGRGQQSSEPAQASNGENPTSSEPDEKPSSETAPAEETGERKRRRRRRGRRGRRADQEPNSNVEKTNSEPKEAELAAEGATYGAASPKGEEKPKAEQEAASSDTPPSSPQTPSTANRPAPPPETASAEFSKSDTKKAENDAPVRKGWWQRKLGI